jgi:hypothetical protein
MVEATKSHGSSTSALLSNVAIDVQMLEIIVDVARHHMGFLSVRRAQSSTRRC